MGRGISAQSRHLIARAYAVLEHEHARRAARARDTTWNAIRTVATVVSR